MKRLCILWAITAHVYGYSSGNYPTKGVHTTSHDEIGVCYVEVPTANLVEHGNSVRGNGSRPELSRIRSCCRGYTQNRYDPSVCDPVCSRGCIHSYCVAPETCECYPDYQRNSAGNCVQLCPHSCQNGQCAGNECICDYGYKWDAGMELCLPKCKDNCGGLGTCTVPNYCSCHSGYQPTPEGSCESLCGPCENGTCVGNTCQCHRGYKKDSRGLCKPQCNAVCPRNSECIGPNICSSPTTPVDSEQYLVKPLDSKTQHSSPEFQQYLHSGQQCPHSCQNGHCSGNECVCDFGYKWDSGMELCLPKCKDNCAGLGTCTSPNYCSCRSGYQPTPEGSCASQCGPCEHGTCVGNTCQCNRGYTKDSRGLCKSQCNIVCPRNFECVGPNICSSPTSSVDLEQYHLNPLNSLPLHSSSQYDQSSHSGHQQNANHVDSDSQHSLQSQNRHYTDSQQNVYNPYGTQYQESYNQRSNDHSQQETYRQPQESYDFRNQRDKNNDLTQQQSQDTFNHRQYDSTQHRDSLHTNQNADQYNQGTSYTGQYNDKERNNQYSNHGRNQDQYSSTQQRQYDTSHSNQNVDQYNQGTSYTGQYNDKERRNQYSNQHSNQDQHSSSQQRQYDNQNYDSLHRNQNTDQYTQSTSSGQYNDKERGNQYSNQYSNQDLYSSTQQRQYDYSRQATEGSNQGSYQYHTGSHGSNQSPYPYNSMSNTRETPQAHNDMYSQHATSHQQSYNVDQANVPVCTMACLNGFCVEGNQCRCKPGYVPDKTNPSVCLPHCPGGCANGVCSAPNLCLCNVGYYKDRSIKGSQECIRKPK